MKIGVLTNVLYDLPLIEALRYFKSIGIEMVEIGCSGTGGLAHCDADELLQDEEKFKEFKKIVDDSGLGISAFTCHGNPVHPVKEIAQRYDKAIKNAILLAEKMDVDTIVTFSGCPGGHDGAKYPNWCTTVWPYDFVPMVKYQWEDVLIPYWKETVGFARVHKVKKIALEMHPGFCVYNPKTLLRLREACGEEIGANYDPSHLIWQGIDSPTAIEYLKDAIHHFHVKDTFVNPDLIGRNGFFNSSSSLSDNQRPFNFRLPPGSGTDESHWRKIMTALSNIGYDGTLSIENEDISIGQKEALVKTVNVLENIMIRETDRNCWWRKPISKYQKTFLPEL